MKGIDEDRDRPKIVAALSKGRIQPDEYRIVPSTSTGELRLLLYSTAPRGSQAECTFFRRAQVALTKAHYGFSKHWLPLAPRGQAPYISFIGVP